MEADMAPPHKRRRLTGSSSRPSPSPSFTFSEPTPTLSHTVEQLDQRPSVALIPRPVPKRIEEVHLQIQKRAVPDYHEHRHQRRQQGTAVSSALDSTLTVTVLQWTDVAGGTALSTINDDLGGTYATTQTLTVASSPSVVDSSTPSSTEASSTAASSVSSASAESSQGTPSSTTPAEGFIGNNPSGPGIGVASFAASTQTGSAGSATSTSPSSAGITSASISGSLATNSTRTDTTRSSDASASASSSSSSPAFFGAGVFLATLRNGDVVTVTRSDDSYTTTFADGLVSTIAPSSSRSSDGNSNSSNDDNRSSQTTTRTSDQSSETQRSTPQSSQQSSQQSTQQQQSTITSINVVNGPNYTQQGPASGTAGAISSTSSAAGGGGGGSSDSTTAPPGTIAGGVVGGCAGLAVILLVALVLLRWWKRKAQHGHHALPASEGTPDPETSSLRGQPGMAERAGLRPLVGAVPAFFRHSNRSSEPTVPASERGFTKVSGRKLPSQFSPGISSGEPPNLPPSMPLAAPGARSPSVEHERNLSSHSFYRDSEGFYGGQGTPAAAAAAGGLAFAEGGHSPSPSESLEDPRAIAGRGPTPEEMTLSPGPQRTPTVHRGGPYTMSPSSTVPSTPAMPLSPTAPSSGVGDFPAGSGAYYGGGYGEGGLRSETPNSSVVGGDNRSSRFTEEV